MTMQTTTLPFQVSGASALAQPQRNAAAGVQAPEAAGGFGATLSREIAQRQAMAPTSAPAPAPAATAAGKPAAAAKQGAADKAPAPAPKTAAREPARQKEARSEAAPAAPSATASAADAASSAAEAEAAAADAASTAAQAAAPVTDMLAFMASLMQASPAVAAAPTAVTAGAAEAPGVAGAGAELQLAALQSAFAKLDTAGAAEVRDPALPGAAEGEAAAAGFSLAAGVQMSEPVVAELRTQQQPAQAVLPGAVQDNPGKFQPHAGDAAVKAAAAIEAPAPSVTQLQAQVAKLETMANPAVPGDRIPARVGTQAWDNQVSQRIVYMVGKEQAATLTLNPPDLGPVQVVLNVSNEGASVAFSSNQLEVRQALENAIPRLREMMGESGIALGNATVDAGMPDGRQAQQDGERGHGRGSSGFGNAAGVTAATDDAVARPATRTVALGDSGMVDTFA